MSKTMSYETTPFKVGSSKAIKNNINDKALSQINTWSLIWHIVKRHKFGLVSVYAIIITALWIFPPLPDVIASLLRSL